MRIPLILLLISLTALPLAAQKNKDVHIGYIYPAGAQQGTEIQAVVGGSNIRNVNGVVVNSKDISPGKPKFFMPFKKLNYVKQLRDMVRKYGCIKAPGSMTDADTGATPRVNKHPEKKAEKKGNAGEKGSDYELTDDQVYDILKKLSPLELRLLSGNVANLNNRLQVNPAISQLVVFSLKIAPDARPGVYELRLKTPFGLSDPVHFVVGALQETSNDFLNYKHKNKNSFEQEFKVPTVLNGQILPGETDTFSFRASAGQSFRFSLLGRGLQPFLGDAVPGWFQPVISLTDEKGDELAYADDYQFNPDPVMTFTAPSDGVYFLKVHDSIYRGREDFVYRITVTEADKSSPVATSIALPERFSKLGIISERENNNSLSQARKITLPLIISGKIDYPGDSDIYEFKGKKGMEVVADVMARRYGSPLDSNLILYDAEGKILYTNDDFIRPNIGIMTQHADAYFRYRLPHDGRYYLKIFDTVNHGGAAYVYNLRLSAPIPDYTVYVGPSAINVQQASTVPLYVCVVREDGFNEAVRIQLDQPVEGLKLSGNIIPAGVERTMITLSVDDKFSKGLFPIKLKTNATGENYSRPVIPVDEKMQAFIYKHLLPAGKQKLNVLRRAYMPVKLSKTTERISLTVNKAFLLPLDMRPIREGSYLIFEVVYPTSGFVLKHEKTGDRSANLIITASEKIKSGTSGNIIVRCSINEKVERGTFAGRRNTRNMGYLPAIPFSIQ